MAEKRVSCRLLPPTASLGPSEQAICVSYDVLIDSCWDVDYNIRRGAQLFRQMIDANGGNVLAVSLKRAVSFHD